MNLAMKTLCLIVALLLFAVVGPASAGSPELTNILPFAGQRGTDVQVVLYGNRLKDADQVIVQTPLIQASLHAVKSDQQIIANLTIAADAPLGEHQIRLVTRSGVTEMITFHVVDQPIVSERPEDLKTQSTSFADPQPIKPGTIIVGRTQAEDVDYYAVDLKKGERLSVQVDAMRLGRGFTDSHLSVLDDQRNRVAECDDTNLLRQDPYVGFIAPKAGRYVIVVRDSSYEGGDNNWYLLHVGAFVRPAVTYPLGGKPGENVSVRFIGDVAGDFVQKVALPGAPNNQYMLMPDRDGQRPPIGHTFRVNALNNVFEDPSADNNTMSQVKAGEAYEPGTAFNGIIDKPGDMDYYKLRLRKGQSITVRCFSSSLGSPLDSVVNIWQVKDNKHLQGNDDRGGLDSTVTITAPEDGEYYLRVRDHRNRGGADFVYRLEVTLPSKWMATSIQRYDQNKPQSRQAIAVPAGNRAAALVRVSQQGVTGLIEPLAQGLPQGISLTGYGMVAQGVMPVVFEATNQSPLSVSLVDLGAKSEPIGDSAERVIGRFQMTTPTVVGNPNRTEYFSTTQNIIPVAVTERVPFKLDVVQPNTPLVRDGKLHLKLKLTRDAGYESRVRMFMLWKPPGIGATYEVRLEKTKTEGVYTIDANGSAGLGKWPMVVIALGDTAHGPVWVSSQVFEVTVEEPLVTGSIAKAKAKQGEPIDIVVDLEHNRDWKGQGELKLLGLPAGCKVEPVMIKHGQAKAVFKVVLAQDTPRGQHKSLMCELTIPHNGESIIQRLARGGQLRVDLDKKPTNTQSRLDTESQP